MALGQIKIASEHLSQIAWCCLEDQVKVIEICWIVRLENVEKLDHVAMAFEQSEEHNFSKLALRIMHKCEDVFDLFDGYLSPCHLVDGKANLSIAAMSYFLDKLIVFTHSELHLETIEFSSARLVIETSNASIS